FHLVSLLGRPGDLVLVGRWISIIALALTGLFIGLIVNRYGADRVTSIFSGLLYVVGIADLYPSRLGMDDPQLLGEALTTAGLYGYLVTFNKTKLLWVSALLFCFAGFTKQNLIAFPAAVGIDLLLRLRAAFWKWLLYMVVFAGALGALTI